MSPVKSSLLAAVAATVLVSAGSYWLRQERAAEARTLRSANVQLQREIFLQQRASSAAVPRSVPPAQSAVAVATEVRERAADAEGADYRFQGQATPVDTLQTMAWAMDRGDVDLVMNVITFDPAARPKVEAYRLSLPPQAQAQWPTAEVLAATLLTNRGINKPYPRASLLARATVEAIDEGRVMLRLPGTPKDREVYQKAGDEWKWVVTEALVDAYLADVAREPGR